MGESGRNFPAMFGITVGGLAFVVLLWRALLTLVFGRKARCWSREVRGRSGWLRGEVRLVCVG
jgi:hypothetical protein